MKVVVTSGGTRWGVDLRLDPGGRSAQVLGAGRGDLHVPLPLGRGFLVSDGAVGLAQISLSEDCPRR